MNDPTPSTEKARSVWKPQGSQEDWRPETHTQDGFHHSWSGQLPPSPPGTNKESPPSPCWFKEAPNSFTQDSGGGGE